MSDYEGPRGGKCGSTEGNHGTGCVRAIINENQSDVYGADAGRDNDSYEVFVGCLESDKSFNTVKLDKLKKWEHFEVYDEVKDVSQNYLTGRWICTDNKSY